MASNSGIQWTTHTCNFWTGCKKVSQGCAMCYMYRDKDRYGLDPTIVVQVKQSTINKVLKNAVAGDKIFTCSWSDFFIEYADQWREWAWGIIRDNPQFVWQILTKRPERILQCLPEDWGEGWSHVWIGVSVELQKNIDRVPILQSIPCKTRFISAEPLLGELDFGETGLNGIHWVIVGGESGNDTGKWGYRPNAIGWMERIVHQCKESNVPVFVKQLGTYLSKKMGLKDRHAGDIDEFPETLKVRQFPHEEKE